MYFRSLEWGFVAQCVVAIHRVQAAADGGGCCFPSPLEVHGILTPTGFHKHIIAGGGIPLMGMRESKSSHVRL